MRESAQKKKYIVDGNTVRKAAHSGASSYEQSMDEWLDGRDYSHEQKRTREQRTRRLQRETETRMQLGSFLFLVALTVFAFYACISYLKVRGDVTNVNKEIASLQDEIVTLKDENQVQMEKVDSNVDFSYVYQVATEELGMVHPNQSQIVLYQKTKSDFVKQYSSIPQVKKDNFIIRLIQKLKN